MLLLVPELCLMTGMTDAMRSDFRSVYLILKLRLFILIIKHVKLVAK